MFLVQLSVRGKFISKLLGLIGQIFYFKKSITNSDVIAFKNMHKYELYVFQT